MVVDELDEQLRGTKPGAILEFTATLPERFGELAGSDAKFRVIVKEAKQKVLPEAHRRVGRPKRASSRPSTSCAPTSASGSRRCSACRRRWPLRDKVLDAAADLVPIEAPPDARRQRDASARRGSGAPACRIRAASLEQYLEMTGQEPQAFIDEIRVGAGPGRARRSRAARGGRARRRHRRATTRSTPRSQQSGRAHRTEGRTKVRRELERSGALEAVRSDVARGKALEFLVEHATVVDENGNEIDLLARRPRDTTRPPIS